MATIQYANFDLLFEPAAPAYRVRVLNSPAGEAVGVFDLPLPAATLERLTTVADLTATELQQVGAALFTALFQAKIGACWESSLATTNARGEGLRLRLRLNDAPALAALPWEYLYDPVRQRFLALSVQTPITRYLETQQPPRPLTMALPLRILVVIAAPTDLAVLDGDREWGKLQETFATLQANNLVLLERLQPATRSALQERLLQTRVDILHFVGHGVYDTQAQTGLLAFENERREAELLSAQTLAVLLHDYAPRLVFLNACGGGETAGSNVFTGLAQRLVEQGLPAVIALRSAVTDAAAITLSAMFYRALANQWPVDAALAEARKAIFEQQQRVEWGTPVLFMRAPDGQLFAIDAISIKQSQGQVEPSPFKGLQYFDVADADLFFGREALTAELAARLQRQRLLAVIGASGSGKSSLVRAGLIPALQRGLPLADQTLPPAGSTAWPVHIITPTAHPLESLALTLTQQSESITATTTLLDDLRKDPRTLHLYVSKWLRGKEQAGQGRAPEHLLLVVDQFEELFTLCQDREERRLFVDNLLTAAGLLPLAASGADGIQVETPGPTLVVITLRADFYAECAEFVHLPAALESHQKYIGRMSNAELRRTIEEPARRHGLTLEPGLVDLILEDIGNEPGALPLLSHALLETWQRRRGQILTFAGYQDAGRIQGALAHPAEIVFTQRLTDPTSQMIARNIFLRLTELGEGAQDTRRRASFTELIPNNTTSIEVERVLDLLAAARLLTLDGMAVEVAHEALIRARPRLRTWIDENREALRIRRLLTDAVEGWLALARDPGALYRGARLAQTLEWSQTHQAEMSTAECEFLATAEVQLAETEWRSGNLAYAQRHLEHAIGLAPHLPAPYLDLYNLLVESDVFDQAYKVYTCLLNAAPVARLLPARYQVEAIVGRRALGIIHQAWDTVEQQRVVLTLLQPLPPLAAERVESLCAPLRTLQSLSASRLFALERFQDRYFTVEEWVEGETLRTHLTRVGRLPAAQAFVLLDQIASGLEALHLHGLCHLRLEPENIWVTAQGAKLAYWSEACLLTEFRQPNNQSAALRQSPYWAPEQFAGELGNQASDIYTFGLLVYELFTGYKPGSSAPVTPSQVNPAADEALDLLVERTLAFNPAQRFITISFLRQELRRVASAYRPGKGGQTLRWTLRQISQGLIWARKSPQRVVVLALLAATLLADFWLPTSPLRAATRFFSLLVFQIYPALLLFQSVVHTIARRTGRVALVQSGPGMGGVFGLLMTIWHTRNTVRHRILIHTVDLQPGREFWTFLGGSSLLTCLLLLVVLFSIWLLSNWMHRQRRGYNVGFYFTFFLWCVLVVIFSWNRWLAGLLSISLSKPP